MIANELPGSLQDNPQLDRWIVFEADGRVRLSVGKVEIGQGILTALAQVAAEELDVELSRLRVVSGDTDATPDEGYTVGSMSIEVSGMSVGLVCAEVRSLFLQQAAMTLDCSPVALAIRDGRILRDGSPTRLDYWTLAPAVDLARDVTGTVPRHPVAAHRVIGRNVPRLDLPAKLTGAAFIHDLVFEGMLHGRVMRRPRPGARLQSLDETAVQRCGASVVALGDFVAVVAAREADAEKAHAALRHHAVWSDGATSSPLHAIASFLRSLPCVDAATGPEARPKSAPGTISATFTRPYIAHASIGPSCAIAMWQDGHLTLWTHSQGVGPLRAALSRALDIDAAAISVRHVQGAGCYGHNPADDAALDAALLARGRPGHPVRVQWMREDELGAAAYGSAMIVQVTAGMGTDHRPVDWSVEIWSGPHGKRPSRNSAINLLAAEALPESHRVREPAAAPPAAGDGGIRNATLLYALPPQRVVHHLVPQPPLRTSALRGLGAQANVFALEGFIDELAERAGEDPVAYRLSLLSDARGRRVIKAAADMSAWRDRPKGGSGRGFGFAFSRYKNHAAYLAAVAAVTVDDEVRVDRIWCAVDAGLVINPDGGINQVAGGVIQATSWTLKEQVCTDADGVVGRGWETYPILSFSEVPEVEVRLVGSPEDAPLGMGECAVGPTTAAIGNAVAHALGVRIRDLPLSRERIAAVLLAD